MTTYRSRIRTERKEDETSYRFDLEDPSGSSVFSRTFRAFPNESGICRLIEEYDGKRFFHGLIPLAKVDGAVTDLWRISSVNFFMNLCKKLSPKEARDKETL